MFPFPICTLWPLFIFYRYSRPVSYVSAVRTVIPCPFLPATCWVAERGRQISLMRGLPSLFASKGFSASCPREHGSICTRGQMRWAQDSSCLRRRSVKGVGIPDEMAYMITEISHLPLWPAIDGRGRDGSYIASGVKAPGWEKNTSHLPR